MHEIWLNVFTDELHALHTAGFVHRDLLHPSNIGGKRFDNILLIAQSLLLIEVDISVLRPQLDESFFAFYVRQELAKLTLFREFLLARQIISVTERD